MRLAVLWHLNVGSDRLLASKAWSDTTYLLMGTLVVEYKTDGHSTNAYRIFADSATISSSSSAIIHQRQGQQAMLLWARRRRIRRLPLPGLQAQTIATSGSRLRDSQLPFHFSANRTELPVPADRLRRHRHNHSHQ